MFLVVCCVGVPVLMYGNPPIGIAAIGLAFALALAWGWLFPVSKLHLPTLTDEGPAHE